MAEPKIAPGKRRRNRFGAFIRDSKGATAVEFALIAAPFLALIVALMQTFLLFFAQSVLENAVRQFGPPNSDRAGAVTGCEPEPGASRGRISPDRLQ